MSKNTKLELTWIGKDKRPRLEPRVLIEDPSKSYYVAVRHGQNDIFDNMLIHGDNLLALKALEQQFAGKVKCIYIDPPYTFSPSDRRDQIIRDFIVRREAVGRARAPPTGVNFGGSNGFATARGHKWVNSREIYLDMFCDERIVQTYGEASCWDEVIEHKVDLRKINDSHF